ncbi:MAG: MvaI/BcnI family restriction endonuclease, partial [Elusimicrobia bacterium]|nr:MvaI/BcnI family restriction endonuclease [Elusimicrobiota bacterium]
MKLPEFTKKFKQLKAKGFVPSTRNGPTGVGHTLETYIGLSENNIAMPDIHRV